MSILKNGFELASPIENRGILESLINIGKLGFIGNNGSLNFGFSDQKVPAESGDPSRLLVPESPCPHYFQYIRNGNSLEGQILFKFKIEDPVIELVFEGSVPGNLKAVS
jgi:hypothetical protein